MRKSLFAGLIAALLGSWLAWADGINVPAPAYIAGSWTPTVTTDGTVGTPAYDTRIGTYEQIGRQVTVRFVVKLSGWTGSPTGLAKLSGLPVTAGATASEYAACFVSYYLTAGLPALSYGVGGYIDPGGTSITFTTFNSISVTEITAAQAGVSFYVIGFCSYHP